MKAVIRRALAATNGGPGLTAAELAARMGAAEAVVRNCLASLMFDDRAVTCEAGGRYKLGDPARLIAMEG